MTNAEIILEEARRNQLDGKLTTWESGFVDTFQEWDKKMLRKLTSAQYKKLREIASRNEYGYILKNLNNI